MNNKILFCIILSISFLYPDSFSILPGTKAKGMAGAYVSIVEDTTAGYYNPAGYTVFFSDDVENFSTIITVEAIDILSYNEYAKINLGLEDKLKAKKKPFVGMSAINSNFGFGLSAYSVYDYILTKRQAVVNNIYQNNNTLPTVLYPTIDFFHQKTDIFQVGGAYNALRYKDFNSLISFGASFGIVFAGGEYGTDTRIGKIQQFTDKEKTNKYDLAFAKSVYSGIYKGSNVFYGGGVKARLYDSDKYSLNIGYSFKTKSTSHILSDKENFTATKDEIKGSSILTIPSWGLPTSQNIGLSFSVKKDFGFFTFSYDKSQKEYSQVTNNQQSDIQTDAYGLEISMPQHNIQARIGTYKAVSKYKKHISAKAFTYGVSMILEDSSNNNSSFLEKIIDIATIDMSVETKNYTQGLDIATLNLISISINYEI